MFSVNSTKLLDVDQEEPEIVKQYFYHRPATLPPFLLQVEQSEECQGEG